MTGPSTEKVIGGRSPADDDLATSRHPDPSIG